jgi:hypothetical protein
MNGRCSSFKIMLPMMVAMRRRLLAAVVALVAVGAGAVTALADSVATTEPATQVRSHSAVLNGLANAASGSAWFFQYAESGSQQLNSTTPQPINGTGQQAESFRATGLTPGATYFFRFVVETYNGGNSFHMGNLLTFTTPNGVATTGNATSVTKHSAVLNGVVNVQDPNSEWVFQYGTTTSYGQFTKPQPVGAGVTPVSATITGLKNHTLYHFRLVVAQGSYEPDYSYGADLTFTTGVYGTLSLRKHKLRVKSRTIKIPLQCSGPAGAKCSGRIAITVKGTSGKTIRCAGGKFSIAVGRHSLHKHVRGGCLALLGSASGHRHRGKLTATLTTNQAPLNKRVVLFE